MAVRISKRLFLFFRREFLRISGIYHFCSELKRHATIQYETGEEFIPLSIELFKLIEKLIEASKVITILEKVLQEQPNRQNS